MYVLVSVLIILVCVFLVLIVLVQNSKGGGLAANFSSQNQIMGVRKTTDFLEKATWTLAVGLLVLSLLASATISRDKADPNRSIIEDQIEGAVNPEEAPVFPTAVPETGNEE